MKNVMPIKQLALSAALVLSWGAASAETWTTTSAYDSGNASGLTFSGSKGSGVVIRGAYTDEQKNKLIASGVTAYEHGVGVNAGAHSIDNESHTSGSNFRWLDLITLDFDKKLVTVTDITLYSNSGWYSHGANDKDSELWAFTGTGTPAAPSTGYASWTPDSGWSLVSSWNGNASNGPQTFSNSNATIASSMWLVVAKSSDSHREAFKFKSFSATHKPSDGSSPVPVAGTLALLAIGALAVRRKLAAA